MPMKAPALRVAAHTVLKICGRADKDQSEFAPGRNPFFEEFTARCARNGASFMTCRCNGNVSFSAPENMKDKCAERRRRVLK